MKNLLRKLHIGGSPAPGGSEIRHNLMPSGADARASPPSGSGNSGASGAAAADNSSVLDYNYLEEEYQVQLALAISASSSAPECGSSNDPESLQIKAAKRISLGHFPSPSPAASAVDFLSHRYWSYNVVDYDEKVIDGFYDVYCILADPSAQGKMPSLIDLQETPVSDNVGYEVVLVNRVVDPVLRKLEQKAVSIALECGSAGLNPIDSGLVQRIADLVAVQMGGPVIDADEIVTRWTMKSFELRTSLNNIVLPLGRLQIGLSRHRALLFKVLADCVGVPCRLVKGSYYTGTDDGAVNLIKVDNEREFIIDLMGAPGALIPTETPSISSVSNTAKENRNTEQEIIAQAVQTLCSALEEKDSSTAIDRRDSELGNDSADIDSYRQEVSRQGGYNFHEKCESSYAETRIEQRNFQPSRPRRSPSWTQGEVFSDQMKVNDVSKYVINAANENPGFAQKLHDVLLESGVSPPLHFVDSINSSQVLRDQKITQKNSFLEERKLNDLKKCDDKFPMVLGRPPKPIPRLNSSIHKGIYYDHQVALVEGVGLHSKEKNESISNAPLMQSSTSNTMFAPIAPGIPSFVNSHISSTDSSMVVGQSENVGVQQSIPVAAAVAATAAVVASSLVVATSKCNEVLATSSRVTEFNSGASVGLDKRSTLKCTSNYSNDDSSVSEDKVTVQEGSSWHLKDDNEHSLSLHSEHPVLDDVEECEIRWEDLQIGERIGLGSYGEVYHADWNGTEVAVKKFLDQAFSGDALEQFRSEVRIMRRMRHPNIVLFMGAVTRPPNLSILTEFLPRGSLYRLLHRSSVHLDEKRRLRMALDVAKGMNYLHTSNPVIVHRDLKSPNLLVDKNWVVKVCDFGLSRLKHHTFLSSKSTAGTPEWMAPEVLRNEPANEKCDVYSFGVILWELATLRMPWSGMNPMQVVGAVGFQNRRLEIPIDVDPLVAKIISQCWHNDPNMRPSFGQLMLVLKSLQRLVISTP